MASASQSLEETQAGSMRQPDPTARRIPHRVSASQVYLLGVQNHPGVPVGLVSSQTARLGRDGRERPAQGGKGQRALGTERSLLNWAGRNPRFGTGYAGPDGAPSGCGRPECSRSMRSSSTPDRCGSGRRRLPKRWRLSAAQRRRGSDGWDSLAYLRGRSSPGQPRATTRPHPGRIIRPVGVLLRAPGNMSPPSQWSPRRHQHDRQVTIPCSRIVSPSCSSNAAGNNWRAIDLGTMLCAAPWLSTSIKRRARGTTRQELDQAGETTSMPASAAAEQSRPS